MLIDPSAIAELMVLTGGVDESYEYVVDESPHFYWSVLLYMY